MPTQDKNQILGAIQDTLNEVQEILAKSGHMPMEKAEGDDMPPAPEGEAPAAEGEGDAGAPPAAPEAGAEGAAPAGEEGMGHEDPAQALAEQAKQLSDEELDHMINALMMEKEARHGGEGEGEGAPMPPAEGAGEAAAEGAAPPSGDEAEKSMKSEFASLAKSLTAMAEGMTKLTSEVAALKAKPAAAPARVTAKPAAANKQAVQVLEKSTPVKQRLSKSDTLTFAEGQIRQRTGLVTREDIAELCNAPDGSPELHAVQDRLEMAGVKFPTK